MEPEDAFRNVREAIVAKFIHAARCNACGGAPSYSGEHRRPVSREDLRQARALLAELDES
jgi:hypothetical protein